MGELTKITDCYMRTAGGTGQIRIRYLPNTMQFLGACQTTRILLGGAE
jgi:hypothetical protein